MLLPVISIDAESGLGHARYLVLLVITVILLVVLGTPGSTSASRIPTGWCFQG